MKDFLSGLEIDWKSLITAVVGGLVVLLGDLILVERRAVLNVRGEYVAEHQDEIRRFRQFARLGAQKGMRVEITRLSDSTSTQEEGASVDTLGSRLITLPAVVLDPTVQGRWQSLLQDLKERRKSAPPTLVGAFDRVVRWVERHPLPSDSVMRLPEMERLEVTLGTTIWRTPDSISRWYSLNANLEGRAEGLLNLER